MSRNYYLLSRETLASLFAAAAADYDVVAKTRDVAGNLLYDRPRDYDAVVFTAEKPTLSAKAVALPPAETLIDYKREGKSYSAGPASPPARPLLLWGCNLCDAAAFEILDRVFTWDFQDDPYLARRAAMTVFALACVDLQKDCFCDRIRFPENGVDALAYPWDADLLVETRTARGETFVQRYRSFFSAAPEDVAATLAAKAATWPTAKKDPDLSLATATLQTRFAHPDWKTLVSTCIGCGTCTYLCPTCHCFDIQDEGGVYAGARRRIWDHCTGRTFTLMPSHQPRDRQYKRYRQRLLHKFWYYPERFQYLLCTGCGRCITHCPVHINIRALVEYFGGLRETPPGGARHK